MPGTFQKTRSSPQKQPIPKSASSVPSGNGGVRRAPLTKCFSGTGMGVARPGSASSLVTIEALWRPNMACPPSEDDLLVAKLADLLGREPALGEDLLGVLAPERRGPPHPRRHPRELDRAAHHGNLAELRVDGLLDD